MLYLLDASVLITANNTYYPVDCVPEFWEWLIHMSKLGNIKMPLEIFEEVKDGPSDADKDLLFGWIQQEHCKSELVLKEEANPIHVQSATVHGYAPDLKDDELEQVGRDPFLVAYALAAPSSRCVVTVEVSKPKKLRANRHLPDVCAAVGVKCCDPFTLLRALGFRTDWKKYL